MKRSRRLLLIALFSALALPTALAQPRTITGLVKDSNGEPVVGASVIEKDAKTVNGAITDLDGNFTITAPKGAEMVVSFLGCEDNSFFVTERASYEVILKVSTEFLDEVVVIGMDNRQTRKSITGAVSTISTKDIVQSPVANISNALAGKMPGLVTVQYSGEPGSDASSLYVRGLSTYGTSSPLIVIDGLPRNKSDLDQIDPNEIASVSVLKDASSSSLYGIQGANGVIVVTTKRGTADDKPLISFTAQCAIQQPIRLPQTMSSYDQARYNMEKDLNDGQPVRYTEEVLDIIKSGSDPYLYPNTDWFDMALKKLSMQHQYNLSVSGSARNRIRYFISGSYINQGTLLNHERVFRDNYGVRSKFDRFNFRSNIDVQATDRFSVRVDLASRVEKRIGPSTSFSNIFSMITSRLPSSQAVFNPDGSLAAGSNLEMPTAYTPNPYGELTQSGYYDKTQTVNYGTLSAKYDFSMITKGLSAQVNFSFENTNYAHEYWSQSYDCFWYRGVDSVTGQPVYQQKTVKSKLSQRTSEYIERSIYYDVRLNYDRSFGPEENHNVSAQILGNRTLKNIAGNLPYAYQGISSRVTYNYAQRYFVEGNLGFNGSENFPPKKRYGVFPSISAGWVISEEPFVKADWLKILKVRASVGMVGNDKIGGNRWLYITEYKNGGTLDGGEGAFFGKNNAGTSSEAGINESQVGNMFVTWEQATKINAGFDLSLFKNNMLNFTFDYFHENRDNILTAPGTINDYFGVESIAPRNSGRVLNQGFEAEIRYNQQISKDFMLFANAQCTYATNVVLENDQPTPKFDYQDLRGYAIGYSLGYKSIGYFTSYEDIGNSPRQSFGTVVPGDIKYQDTNNDGVVDPDDRVPIKVSSVPKWVIGFSWGFNWRNFDFSMMLNGALGSSALCYVYESSIINNDRWSPSNMKGKVPVPHSTNNNSQLSDHYLVSTNYLKIRNLELGYSLPKKAISKIRLASARIYFNAQNLAVFDNMWLKDRDPESAGSAALPYPLQRIFNFGVRFELK